MILMNHGKPELSNRLSTFHLPRTTSYSSSDPSCNSGFGFPRVQICVQSMFSGLAFPNKQIFLHVIHEATYHQPHFLLEL